MKCSVPAAAVLWSVILSSYIWGAEPQGTLTGATKMFSIPVSPSVVATVANREGDLAMLALWRGGAKWYGAGTARSSSSGGSPDGTLRVSVQYESIALDLLFEPGAQRLTVHDSSTSVPKDANVFLIDGVDKPGGGKLIRAFYLDAAGANLDIRHGLRGLTPLLSRSEEIVSFLECDRWPEYLHGAEPCMQMKKK